MTPYFTGHPDMGGTEADEQFLKDHRDELTLIATVSDDTLSYEFDDWEITELNGEYFVCSAAGCSCPSPTETWSVVLAHETREAVWAMFASGNYPGFTIPDEELKALLDKLWQPVRV